MNITQLTEGLKKVFFLASGVEKDNPWVLDSGQQINFISLPLVKSEAVEKVKILGLLGITTFSNNKYSDAVLDNSAIEERTLGIA